MSRPIIVLAATLVAAGTLTACGTMGQSAGATAELELDDIGIVTDIDTPEELARAEALLRERLSRG